MRTQPNRPYLFRFTSTDGLRIACARWDSQGPVLGIVQIAHGLGEHIGRYAGLIEYLVQAGFFVYGNDHRGHGHTALSRKNLGDQARDENAAQELIVDALLLEDAQIGDVIRNAAKDYAAGVRQGAPLLASK
jgi:alpha-beta hydrolase superfamily lysophospholipase